MSEFGNETASAAFRMGEKSLDVLMKLFRFLLERKEKMYNAEIQKEKYNEVKLKKGQTKAKLKVEGKTGFVKAKILQRTGEPLVALNITLNEQQMNDFAVYAKKFGLLYTSISDSRLSGDKIHTFYVREKDLTLAKIITDRMTEDLQLKPVDEMITELNNKPVKNEKDLKDLAYLEGQKNEIIRKSTRAFNNDNADIIFNDVCGMLQDKSLSFDKALNRFTDRDFSRNEPYYACERTNPNSYIEMVSTHDSFEGEQYTKTDYKVFHNGIEQAADLTKRKDGKFTDERFSGRPKGYWPGLKNEMKQKGGFSDDLVIFNTKSEFLRYQQLYKEQQRELMVSELSGEYRDYASIGDHLKEQLDKNNAELDKNGFAVDKVTKEPLVLASGVDAGEKARIAESIVITKQIANYKALGSTEVKLAMDKLQLENMQVNTKEYNELAVEIKATEQRIESGLRTEQKLITERSQINGVQAVSEVDKEYVAEQQKQVLQTSVERNEDTVAEETGRDTHTVEEWKEQVSELKEQMGKNVPSPMPAKSIDKAVTSKDDR